MRNHSKRNAMRAQRRTRAEARKARLADQAAALVRFNPDSPSHKQTARILGMRDSTARVAALVPGVRSLWINDALTRLPGTAVGHYLLDGISDARHRLLDHVPSRAQTPRTPRTPREPKPKGETRPCLVNAEPFYTDKVRESETRALIHHTLKEDQ